MSRIALRLLNGIYGLIISSIIMTSSIYAVYSIWDNAQVYQAAENVQNEIRKLKPIIEEGDDGEKGPGFDELRKVNEDVVGWITVDNTNIDYPVLQGDTNLTYMDRDVYGEFSMAGSIFLDVRNNADFSDNYSLIYGHNMDEHLMFGDIALFKDLNFFKENTTANLMIPGESRDMYVVAVMQISAGTEQIFNPYMWRDSLDGLGSFLEKNSIWYHTNWTDKMKESPDDYQIVTLVTCSSGSTNDRSVLVLIREKPKPVLPDDPDNPDNPDKPDKPDKPGKPDDDDIGHGESSSTGDRANPKFWLYMTIGSFLFIVLFESYDRKRKAL